MNVQEAALKAVTDEGFHGAIDGKTRELSILPRVCWLVVKGTAVRVKVNALLCLSKTFHFYQVRAVVDKVSSLLSQVVHTLDRFCRLLFVCQSLELPVTRAVVMLLAVAC